MPSSRAIAAPASRGLGEASLMGYGAALSIGLSAVIVAASIQEPRVLTIRLPHRAAGGVKRNIAFKHGSHPVSRELMGVELVEFLSPVGNNPKPAARPSDGSARRRETKTDRACTEVVKRARL